jgi:hypothetical protein
VNWNGLIVIGGGSLFAWFSWRWSIPYNDSFYKMTRNRPMQPGSFSYRMTRFNRWVGVVFGCFFAVAGVGILFSGH